MWGPGSTNSAWSACPCVACPRSALPSSAAASWCCSPISPATSMRRFRRWCDRRAMNPADIPNVGAMLQLWMLAMIRPGAAFLAAPVFGAANVPVQLRLVIALAVGVPAVAASGMALPADGLVSWPGFILILGEVVVGLAIGFVLQMGLRSEEHTSELKSLMRRTYHGLCL